MKYLGLKKEATSAIAQQLNILLADYHLYYQTLRAYHWHVSGIHFFDLHEKFEELYNEAKVVIDDIAERILTLREKPNAQYSTYLKTSGISEKPTDSSTEMVINILEAHTTIIDRLRKVLEIASTYNDEGTIDMSGAFLASIEKSSWMLDAWLGTH